MLTAVIAVPIGIGAAIYLEEYGKRGRMARLIEINIANLAGVPSIIYGLLGLGLFVRTLGLGRSVLAGRRDARAAGAAGRHPVDARGAAHGAEVAPRGLVRARRDQVADDLAPGAADGDAGHPDRAHPGAVARDWRDGAAHHDRRADLRAVPAGSAVWSPFTVLPIQIFNWVSRPQAEFLRNAAAGIIVLLVLLLTMNAVAIWLRDRYQKQRTA